MSKEQRLVDYVLGRAEQDSLKGNPEKVLAAIDEFAKTEKLMIIGKYKGKLILEEMAKVEPTLMVELGCYVGYLAILFANALAQVNKKIAHTGCVLSKYYSFEVNAEYAALASQLIELAGLSDCVEIIVGAAGHTLPDFEQKLSAANKKYTAIDFVFIDHSKDMYVPDLRVLESLGLIAPGTVICADNIYTPGAPDYVEYVQGSPQYRKEYDSTVVNASNKTYPGRWNILYESRTVPVTNPERGNTDAVEVTKCSVYLSG